MATDAKRTKMIHIYTPKNGRYRLEIERETIRTYENGDTMAVGETRLVHRVLADLGPLPIQPVMIETYDDLRAVIAACADALAEQDDIARAAESARRAAIEAEEAAAKRPKP